MNENENNTIGILMQELYSVIPPSAELYYDNVFKLINLIDPELLDCENLINETTKILLVNQIYSIFMASGHEFSREFLFEKVNHIANCNPLLYNEEEIKNV